MAHAHLHARCCPLHSSLSLPLSAVPCCAVPGTVVRVVNSYAATSEYVPVSLVISVDLPTEGNPAPPARAVLVSPLVLMALSHSGVDGTRVGVERQGGPHAPINPMRATPVLATSNPDAPTPTLASVPPAPKGDRGRAPHRRRRRRRSCWGSAARDAAWRGVP
jgi:hypothetical protein